MMLEANAPEDDEFKNRVKDRITEIQGVLRKVCACHQNRRNRHLFCCDHPPSLLRNINNSSTRSQVRCDFYASVGAACPAMGLYDELDFDADALIAKANDAVAKETGSAHRQFGGHEEAPAGGWSAPAQPPARAERSSPQAWDTAACVEWVLSLSALAARDRETVAQVFRLTGMSGTPRGVCDKLFSFLESPPPIGRSCRSYRQGGGSLLVSCEIVFFRCRSLAPPPMPAALPSSCHGPGDRLADFELAVGANPPPAKLVLRAALSREIENLFAAGRRCCMFDDVGRRFYPTIMILRHSTIRCPSTQQGRASITARGTRKRCSRGSTRSALAPRQARALVSGSGRRAWTAPPSPPWTWPSNRTTTARRRA